MKINNNKMLLNTSGERSNILINHDDMMKVVITCPNCGQPTPYGKTRMISGYTGCDNIYKEGQCYYDDLMPRVMNAHNSEDKHLRKQYTDGDLYNKNKTIVTVVKLKQENAIDVIKLDDITGNNVSEWLDSDMCYGLYRNRELIGYLTLGYADDCGDIIENHPQHHFDARVLSNVYIKTKYRNKGFAYYMIHTALLNIKDTVFLTLIFDDLVSFYEKLNFEIVEDNVMILKKY